MDGMEEVVATLRAQRAEVEAYFLEIPAGAVGTPCTESEHPGGAPWSPKDHLAHLVVRERDFGDLLERAARGETDLLGDRGDTPAERDAFVNRENQREVDARRGVALEALLSEFGTARERTCALLGMLARSVPPAISLAPGNEVPLSDLAGGSGNHARLHLDLLRRALGSANRGRP